MARSINDHSFWGGGRSEESVLAKGAKAKRESSAEGAGEVMSYEDTTEKVKAQQELAKSKVKSHPMKPLTRN